MNFLILSLISAAAINLAFMPVNFTYFIYVALIPFILMNENLEPRKAFFYSIISGVFFYGIRFYWMMDVLYQFNGFKFFYVYLLVILVTAIFFGILGVLISIFKERKFRFLYTASALVIIEYLRGNIPIIAFTWGRFSDVLYNQPLILQLSKIGGEWLLLYLIVLINYLILNILKRKKTLYIIIVLLILAGMFLSNEIYFHYQQNDIGKIKIAILQPNINPWKKYYENTDNEIYSMIKKSLKQKPNYVVLPEATFMYENIRKNIVLKKLSDYATLIIGSAYFKNNRFYNSDFIIRKGKFQEYRKHRLVPYVEYVPFRNLFGKVAGVPSGDTTPGTSIKIFGKNKKFGIEICFESIFPELAKKYAENGADFVVVSTNDGWFGKTFAVEEHFRKLNIIAAETGLNFIQSANTGISGFVDYNGITIVKSQKNKKEILYIEHKVISHPTLYDKTGSLWVFLLITPAIIVNIIEYLKIGKIINN
jgi:apolipoprotein N-acyltransferase